MNFNKPAVSLKDKQKAKSTIKLFGIFAIFSTIATVLSAVFMPKAKTLVGINNSESHEIKQLVSLNYGEEFCVISESVMQVYDTDSKKLLKDIPFKQEVIDMVSTTKGVTLDTSSFIDGSVTYQNVSDNSGYLLMFDTYGDLFRYDYVDGEFTLSNDCYLSDRFSLTVNEVTTTYTNAYKVRGHYIDNNDLYLLVINNNKFQVNVLDLNDLSSGVKKTRPLYTIKVPSLDEIDNIEAAYKERIKPVSGKNLRYDNTPFYIVDPIANNGGENPYDIYVKNDKLYLLTSSGVYYMAKDFTDFDGVSIYNDASAHYVASMRNELLGISEVVRNSFGISDELFASLPTASDFVVISLFKKVFEDTYFPKTKEYFAHTVVDFSTWLAYLDPTMSNMSYAVYEDAVNDSITTVFIDKDPTNTLDGVVYAPKTDKIYFINDRNNTIYSLSTAIIDTFAFKDSRSLLSVATDTGVTFKGKDFFDNHSSISYDPVGESLHVLFRNDKDLCVVDIGEETSVRYIISSQYDISGFNEKKDGSKLVIIYKTEKVTIHNVVTTPFHVDVINPNLYRYHSVFVFLVVFFAILLAVCLVVILISLSALKREKKMLKLKVIKRDLKRNKWTYVALIPFIVLLIMFCYVEAVGSISFSFFSYTMDHPSYIWNDFGNYIAIFNDSEFWLMFGNTFFFLVFDLFLGIVPPIFFAFCLSIIKSKKLSGVLRALMFIPAIVPGIATLLIWRFGIFGNNGVLNVLTCFFRTGKASSPNFEPIEFLVDPDYSRWSLLLMGFPYVGGYLIFYGGLMNIPHEYHEATQLEGIGIIERFFKIDLPLIKPQIKYIFVMGILSSAQNYERTYMLGSTGTTTLVESMYRQMKDYTNYGKASAYATIIFLLLLVPVLINFKDTRKNNLGDQI